MPVVRFAPAPTGFLHIGGARTCLFNWLYARNTKGKFILRIEDTNKSKFEQRYLDEILESLKWLGLDWDELFFQSKRFDIYKQYAEKLLKKGEAYKEGDAIIYKIPENAQIKFFDILRGEISVDTEQLKDQVLIKSDGSPAYNFCCVVDDALMGMTHIIRGDDHIANTPKQIMLYQAIRFKLPKFVHIPMIHGEDGSKMSKRHGATAISEYKNQGYLPQALVNYLALLGWNPGNNKEIFTLEGLIKEFSLKRINKSSAIFDINKLNWINNQYIKSADVKKLVDLIRPEAEKISDWDFDTGWLEGLINLYRTRFSTAAHFLKLTEFFFKDAVHYDEEAVKKYLLDKKTADELEQFARMLDKTEPFQAEVIEKNSRGLVKEMGIEAGEIIHPLRVSLTGGTVSPSIFEVIQFIGKKRCVKRLETVVKKMRARTEMFDKLGEL